MVDEVFDVSKLVKAVDNENNSSILELTSNEIKREKNDILQKLNLPREKLLEMHEKLKEYRFISELKDLNYGSYVRWINLENEDIKLSKGGVVCNINIIDNDDIIIKCKGPNVKIFYNFSFTKSLVFQKLSDQEKIILLALDNLV